LICDTAGIPLAITLTGGNRNDVTQLLPLVDGVGPVRGKPAGLASAPSSSSPTAAMTTTSTAASCGSVASSPVVARRNTEHGSGLGKLRWVVERTFAWLHFFRRLRIRWERRLELHEAFLHLSCSLICQRYLRATWPDAASLKGG
jgi:transposase